MLNRYFYSNTISGFLHETENEILGKLSQNNLFSLEQTQRNAWIEEIEILKNVLGQINDRRGIIFFEYSIPRMGSRIDVVLLLQNIIFVLEFKVGEKTFTKTSFDQVFDYSLDLKNFHETSHEPIIAPILIATHANDEIIVTEKTPHDDNVLVPIKANKNTLKTAIEKVLGFPNKFGFDLNNWSSGRYSPTPTIIEAATALYNNHSVTDISRNDASAINLSKTSNKILEIINKVKENKEKAICFVTGVPGAGKTLVGLNVATMNLDKDGTSSVFLSGNGPLVRVLVEALSRDKYNREKQLGNKVRKGDISRQVKMFIQNVHHFRDEYLTDKTAPHDHVAIFDEAQRAWDQTQTSNFMSRRKNNKDFSQSEPEFLISCMDRHQDWAVIICLVGGGQEINTGEAGISEWIEALNRSFPHWNIYISSQLSDNEYAAGKALEMIDNSMTVNTISDLHLSVSMRSFRAENVSLFVKKLLDLELENAKSIYRNINSNYPIVLTRDIRKAKNWLKEKARGSERYGIVVSSQAERLKPYAIDVKSPMDPIHWFLNSKEDVRSSYYLEHIATEFHVQGLELDWVCITWDADFRHVENKWETYSFVGDKWQNIRKEQRKKYLKNAYRVLLTRARQGMVIVVPNGDTEDTTRNPKFYDGTYEYLKQTGIEII